MTAALLEAHGVAHRRLRLAALRALGGAGADPRARRSAPDGFAAAVERVAQAAEVVNRSLERARR